MQQNQVISGTHHTDTPRAEASGCHATVQGSNVDRSTSGDWAVMVMKVLRLQEEGIFRTIVGYL